MHIAHSISSVRRAVSGWRRQRRTVGLVPTMGALHEGHLALIRHAKRLCHRTVVSIFVNPRQFGPGEDFAKYPRSWGVDRSACKREGVDLVFAPTVDVMYPKGFVNSVKVGRLGELWEGRSRPGHFDGVATVVTKLFNIVQPDVAIFGQKDYQQCVVIRRLVTDFDLPVKIVVTPTVREPGGLALSSRNIYLDAPSRADAQVIYRSLKWAGGQVRAGVRNVSRLTKEMSRQIEKSARFEVDYIGFCDPNSLEAKKTARTPLVILIAARCIVRGPAFDRRFIDNILIR